MGTYKNANEETHGVLERLLDLEHLLDATLSGFGVPSATSSDYVGVAVDLFGRTHQVESGRLIANKVETKAARVRAMFAG
jgi:hypothetical protein